MEEPRSHYGALLYVVDAGYPSRAYISDMDGPTGSVEIDAGGAHITIYGPAYALRGLAVALNRAADKADALPARVAA